ncbi:hypothetical protein WJ438_33525 [Streptomyces sp. GD-15H]|uniref:hypothetical protein n=1 Tax=Streptomyces sp. GD-15H TaxID=3129112 RepID=UPI0032487F54
MGTVVSAIHGRSGSAREWTRSLRARASDGIVLVTSALEPVLHEELRILGVPLVVVDPVGSPPWTCPPSAPPTGRAAWPPRSICQALGHRRIGLVTGPPRLLCSRARLDGYRAALEGTGVAVDESPVVPGDFRPESPPPLNAVMPRPAAAEAARKPQRDSAGCPCHALPRSQGRTIPRPLVHAH